MKNTIKIILLIALLSLYYYKIFKQKKEYEKQILSLQQKNQELRLSLDSLKIVLLRHSSSKIDKKEIREYISSFLSKRSDKFLPDISPISTDFVISQKFSLKHPAIDLATPLGTEVHATASGVVDTTYFDKYFGNTIILDHLNGFKTQYSHLAKIMVKNNYCVKKNDIIGLVGSTGRSSAPHLHYEIIKDDKNINPIKFIKKEN